MVLAVVLALIGAFVIYRGVREMMHLRRLRSEGRQTYGRVTGHHRRTSGSRSVVVSWTDDYGATHELTSNLSSSKPTMEIGETVTVRYLAGDTASAWIDERRENVRSLLLTLILGLGFTAAGATLAVKSVTGS
ncbi:DUF3592 domain-containing protein [Actinoplanes sp. LDG1-06]|uniref:DUF3592 domain-containing protein n=1 Tax=Paractinoplanes ovalisporus TaxID=2810368 RepID=A0ABS2A322_9ACTN|nr:DUF3592 domain-containing protein [Actinoplanes ovalisporus]MBM2614246.1 DUF3592 domain-containing protein [Actinoplanes ovalisporus]